MKNLCKAELDKAIPILNKAKDAVGSIDKKGLQEMKAYSNPPALVEMVLKAVCLLSDGGLTQKSSVKILRRRYNTYQIIKETLFLLS